MELGEGIKYTMYGLFDGHGGNGTSMKVAMELPLIIHQNLLEMLPLIRVFTLLGCLPLLYQETVKYEHGHTPYIVYVMLVSHMCNNNAHAYRKAPGRNNDR